MPLFHAFLLGLVEGLTEFLPVSSTGHLLIVSDWLGVPKDQADAFDIVIQLGAILAVVVHYRQLLGRHLQGLLQKRTDSWRLALALLVAFVPTVVVALSLRKLIKAKLFGTGPVVVGLVVGGVVMIVVELWRRRKQAAFESGRSGAPFRDGVESIGLRDALAIGVAQCAALWPGTSRSLATIVGGQLRGLSARTAADFAFLLGLPTLGGAALYEGWKERVVLAECGLPALALGLITSFFVAWAVIASFLRYLGKGSLIPFGLYRFGFAAITVWVATR